MAVTDTMAELGELQMQVIPVTRLSGARSRPDKEGCNVQERKVGKRGGEENLGYEASEVERRREDEVAKTGYGSIQVSGPEPVHVFYENIEHDLKPFSSKNSKPRGK